MKPDIVVTPHVRNLVARAVRARGMTFLAAPASPLDWAAAKALVDAGFLTEQRHPRSTVVVYRLTEAGKEFASSILH